MDNTKLQLILDKWRETLFANQFTSFMFILDFIILEDFLSCYLQQLIAQKPQQGGLLWKVGGVHEVVGIVIAKGFLLPKEKLVQRRKLNKIGRHIISLF